MLCLIFLADLDFCFASPYVFEKIYRPSLFEVWGDSLKNEPVQQLEPGWEMGTDEIAL